MTVYAVGKLYHPSRTRWPETAQYNFRAGHHELVLFYADPSKDEVREIAKARCEFALVERESAIVLCFRFGSGEWSDAPFSWHLVPERERDLPSADLEAEKRAVLTVVLVDAGTGITRALRQVSWTPAFTRAMHEAIRKQADAPWDDLAFGRAIQSLYAIAPTSQALVSLATATTRGGA